MDDNCQVCEDKKRLRECRARYERVKESMSQSDRIMAECTLFLVQCMMDRQQDNRNIQPEVEAREGKGSNRGSPGAGGNAGIRGD